MREKKRENMLKRSLKKDEEAQMQRLNMKLSRNKELGNGIKMPESCDKCMCEKEKRKGEKRKKCNKQYTSCVYFMLDISHILGEDKVRHNH